MTLTPPTGIIDGYHAVATLNWAPTAKVDVNTEIVVRVQDSRGGATLNSDTGWFEWTPGYDQGESLWDTQAGSYTVTVTATDDGDGTGTPAVSQLVLPIVVSNANRAPDIGDISNAFVNKNEVIEIPVFATDADGNPLTLTLSGLPRFATYTQNPPTAGGASGVIRFTPGEGDRGDYTITVVASDDGGGDVNQTFGIERTVNTVAGATYVLNMDLAGHLGYSADYTRIGIYVNGVKIGSADNTSPVTGLVWTNRSFSFVGDGSAQTIRIVAEPTIRESNGRGMMIDDIGLLEVLPPNTVRSGGTLLLSAIGASLADTDGSETLHLSIGALPVGATLTDGTHVFVAGTEQTTVDITGWTLGQLRLTIPSNQVGAFDLTVTATAVEASNGDTASTTGTMTIHVLPQVSVISSASSASITIVSGSGGTASASSGIVIDWGGTLLSLLTGTPVRSDEWVGLYPPLPQPSLAEQTGLVVRIE